MPDTKQTPQVSNLDRCARHIELTDPGAGNGDDRPPVVVGHRAAIDGHDITPILRRRQFPGPQIPPATSITTGEVGEVIVTFTLRADAIRLVDREPGDAWTGKRIIIDAPDGTEIEPLVPQPPAGQSAVRPVGDDGQWVQVSMFCGALTIRQ